MVENHNHISDGELFADLQQSAVDIALINLLDSSEARKFYNQRLIQNQKICDTIGRIIHGRFSQDQIIEFLEDGYPRQVDLTKGS